MKKILFLFCAILCLSLNANAQGLVASPYVISEGGNHVDTAGLSITWTVGEPVTKTLSNGGLTLTQGFNQPKKDCVAIDIIEGCTDVNACNFDENANTNNGTCDYGETDCPDPCNAVLGCIDPTALNYDPTVNCDIGNCEYEDVLGCMDANACNFDGNATVDDGTCDYGVSDCPEPCNAVFGCLDPAALNYDDTANCDDGNCQYEEVYGSVTTLIYYDENNNGVFDGDDELLSNVPVLINFPDGSSLVVTSNADGEIYLGDLPFGDYTVTVYTPAGYIFGNGETSANYDFTISDSDLNVTFGTNSEETQIPVIIEGVSINCDDLETAMLVKCNNANGTYDLLISHTGAPSFTVTNNLTGEVIVNNSSNVTSLGPYPLSFVNDGANVTIAITDNEECFNVQQILSISCSSVAVELITFEGSVLDNGNLIQWSTASERDIDYFVVEKSYQVSDRFVGLGSVNAKGNSNTITNYQVFDNQVESGVSYYRLVEVTTSGERIIASRVIALEKNSEGAGIVEVSPIPTTDILNLMFNSLDEYLTINIYDLSGKLIRTELKETAIGLNEFQLDIKDFPVGAYFLNVVQGENSETIRIIKD